MKKIIGDQENVNNMTLQHQLEYYQDKISHFHLYEKLPESSLDPEIIKNPKFEMSTN